MSKEIRKISLKILSVIALVIVGFAVTQTYAQPLIGNYGFGPGTSHPGNGQMLSVRVPARTRILGVIVRTRKGGTDPSSLKVKVELVSPQGVVVATRFGWAGLQVAELPVMADPAGEGFISQRGCPGTWRIRIVNPNFAVLPAPIFGTVTVDYKPPPNAPLDIVNMPNVLPTGQEVTRNLTGRTQTGFNPNLIAGTGIFSIRPNWTTNSNAVSLVRVRLMKPNGQQAIVQQGQAGQINLSFTVTPQDASMPGNWRLMVRNLLGPNITNFNLGTFDSSFLAQCTPPPSIAFRNVIEENNLLLASSGAEKVYSLAD